MARYRIKADSAKYYHKGKFYGPGSVIDLPDKIQPGKGMEAIDPPAPPAKAESTEPADTPAKAEKSAKAK